VPRSEPWTKRLFYGTVYIAFVALAIPFDPLKMLQAQALPLLETDQETQRNSNIAHSDPVGVARVRLDSEGTGNSEVV